MGVPDASLERQRQVASEIDGEILDVEPTPDPRSAAGLRGLRLFSGPLYFAEPPYIPEADPDRPGLPPVAVPVMYTVRLKRRPGWRVFLPTWRQLRAAGIGRIESLQYALVQAFGWSWLLRRPKWIRKQLRRGGEGSRHG